MPRYRRPPKPKKPKGIMDSWDWWPEKEGEIRIDPKTMVEKGQWILR